MISKKKPDEIIKVGGRIFNLFKYYDESLGEELLNFPDFNEGPEYTDEGRPFKLAVQESCQYGRDDDDPEDPDPGDCGGCKYFRKEQPYDPIGVCMCDLLLNTGTSGGNIKKTGEGSP